MEGTSQADKRRFLVHREFVRSRIEQARLAEAYRRILPNERLHLVERGCTTIEQFAKFESRPVLPDMNPTLDCVMAMGGP